jgi:hypothetical protein
MALVTKNFSDIITFTRASTATFFNSAGVLTSAAVDAPRFDYNPSALAAQGLLVEESRTNLLTYSEDFSNAVWSPTLVTVTSNTTVAPSNTTTADTITDSVDAAPTTHLLQISASITNGVSYTISCFAKQGTLVGFAFLFPATGFTSNISARFRLDTGVVASTDAGVTAAITNAGNGWYRCTATATATSTVSAAFQLRTANATTTFYQGTGTGTIILWGAQLEAGAFPTSYIPTTVAQVTRAADVASVNTLSPWYNASTGTIFAEFLRNTTPAASTFPQFVNIDDGTVNNRLAVSTNSSRNLRGQVAIGGTFTTISTANAYTEGVVSKLALGYQALNHAAVANGGTAATDTTVNVPSGLTTMRLGDQAGGAGNINGYLRRITYYSRKLSSAELQAITT